MAQYSDWEDQGYDRQMKLAEALRAKGLNTTGEMRGRIYVPKNPWVNFAEGAVGGILDQNAQQGQQALQGRRDQEFNTLLSQRPSANQQLPMQGPTEDGTPLQGSFTQQKSPDQYNNDMTDFGTRLMGSRDPRAQAIAGQVLTRSLEHPYKEMERQRNEQEAQAFLKTLGGRTEPATAVTGEEAGLSGAFKGDIRQLRKDILAIPDPVERQAAMEHFEQQVAAAAPKSVPVLPSTIAAARPSTAKFAAPLAAQEKQKADQDFWQNVKNPAAVARQEDSQAFTAEQNEKKINARIEAAKKEPPNPETVKLIAERFVEGDKNAMVGLSRNGPLHQAVLNEIAVVSAKRGLNARELVQRGLEYSGANAEQTTLGHRAAQVNMAAIEAREMIPIVIDLSGKVDRSKYPSLNTVINAYETQTGDPSVLALGQSIDSLINAYARAISPVGVPTQGDKAHARTRLDTAYNSGQIAAVAQVMDREIEAALKSPTKAREAARESRGLPPLEGTEKTVLPQPKDATKPVGETKTYKGVTYRLKPGMPRNQQSSWEATNG